MRKYGIWKLPHYPLSKKNSFRGNYSQKLLFKVNVNKTQVIFFNNQDNPTVTLSGTEIKALETVKYLGVMFDKRLNFKQHIEA